MVIKEKYWHELFEVGVFLKGFNGVWEIASGFLALFLSGAVFNKIFYFLARNELFEDPQDKFINFISQAFQEMPAGAKKFAAFYLLIHGILNIFLAIQLYREKIWAYLVTIGAVMVFTVYQVYRINLYHSKILTAVTILDALFIVLTWHEYNYHLSKNL